MLIHDAQYSAAEYAWHVGWGHSAITHTLGFAAKAGVKRLVTFHHDPGHDDAALDRLIAEACSPVDYLFEVIPGTAGMRIDLGAQSNPMETRA